jgi:hypothetical protein
VPGASKAAGFLGCKPASEVGEPFPARRAQLGFIVRQLEELDYQYNVAAFTMARDESGGSRSNPVSGSG